MKKLLLGLVGVAAVVVGLLIIWNFVIPFLGSVIGSFF